MPATSRLTLTGFGSSGWRREKASRRWVSTAARWAPRMALSVACAESGCPDVRRSRWAASRWMFSRLPTDDGQQIVEIVRDAAGQLADRLHLLGLLQPLLDRPRVGHVAADAIKQALARHRRPEIGR